MTARMRNKNTLQFGLREMSSRCLRKWRQSCCAFTRLILRATWRRLRYHVHYRSLQFFATSRPVLREASADCEFAEIRYPEALRHNATAQLQGWSCIPTSRLQAGHRCLGYLDPAGAVTSWGWVSGPAAEHCDVPWEESLMLRLSGPIAYIWDCHTLPPSRGQGLYRSNIAQIARLMLDSGAKSVHIYCNNRNIISYGGITSAGFSKKIRLLLLKLGPLYLLFGNHFSVVIAFKRQSITLRHMTP